MTCEKSCGAVVFTRRGGERLYVIIRSRSGDCGLPKGRMETGETEQQTALREVWEEVGLRPTLLPGFRETESYSLPPNGAVKQVVYFLAEYSGQSPHPLPTELSEAYLLPYEKALAMLTFGGTRRILTEANRFLWDTCAKTTLGTG